ncbi:MAG: hypothetical protein H6508_06630 [Calditrichaeota bacterium]|nr:hypothetical protein [Calditrichota bacterium]
MRSLAFSLLLLCAVSVAGAREFGRPSYAEVQVGIATPTGLSTFQDVESERVSPGSVGTTLLFSGYFPVFKTLTVSPSFTLLTTDGRVTGDPTVPTAFNVRFHQREFGADVLIHSGKARRLMIGAGTSLAWWTATEENAKPNYDGVYQRGRSIEGQALMGRGIVHVALRNPDVSGASLKLVAAWPLANLIQVNNTAATGYIGLQCGFSMILI